MEKIMSDLVEIARYRYKPPSVTTHWYGCERSHTECLIDRMADSLEATETAVKVLAQRIEDLQAENQKLHGWVASAEATAGKLQGKINAYEERREVDLIVLYSALHFAEFCWRDVPMNEHAFERCEELIAKLRKRLK